MVKTPCCDQSGLKKGPWAPEEDLKLINYIQKHGYGRWRTLPKNAGLQRCGKSCRLRWTNYLRPDIKRGKFSKDEEDNIIHLHSMLGNKWSAIAARLPGRTDNEIKNYWNTHIRKRLLRMGVDPLNHLSPVSCCSPIFHPPTIPFSEPQTHQSLNFTNPTPPNLLESSEDMHASVQYLSFQDDLYHHQQQQYPLLPSCYYGEERVVLLGEELGGSSSSSSSVLLSASPSFFGWSEEEFIGGDWYKYNNSNTLVEFNC